MLHSDRRAVLSRSIVVLVVLAITAGWSTPARAPIYLSGSSAPAAAADRDLTTNAVRFAARDSGWDARAAASAAAAAAGAASRMETTSSPRRPMAQAQAPAEAPAAVKAGLQARAAAAATTSVLEKKAAKAPVARAQAPKAQAPKAQAPTYRGRNHFWIPSLGMSYGVHWYGCSDKFYPGNYIYRWGCAGTNNVYILGHAHSVMKPLHDLYVSGRLRVGMVAVYADANGRVRKYAVTEWRVVRPTEIAWQIASQRVPSMTLQTCVGRDNQYRLNVRLVATN